MTYLDQTNEFIKTNRIDDKERPYFHLTAPIGWINDPNGFSEYNGKKHLFYQYYPYDIKWGTMHWGHAQSDDFIKWEELPIALAPSEDYDSFGCYSGTAISSDDGKHHLFYTGVVERIKENGQREEIQTQCLASGDGISYEKYEKNPLISGEDLPEGFSRIHFRDPKVWFEDGTYFMLVGNLDENNNGQALLFRSPDMHNWEYVSVLADNHGGEYGRMWECPDYFSLDSHDVLIVSPQDMLAKEPNFYNGNHSVALIGQFNKRTNRLEENQIELLDYGTEFYAAQTLLSEDDRRIMVAWMNSWDMLNANSLERNWTGMMTLPRELFFVDGKLHQRPVRELEKYRSESFKTDEFTLSGSIAFPEIKGRSIDLTVYLNGGDYENFTIYFAKNEDFYSSLTFNRKDGYIEFDRTYSGIRRDVVTKRKFKVEDPSGVMDIRLILDKFSVEAFINDGRQTLTAALYTPIEAEDIVFESDGEANIEIESHTIDITKNE